MAWCQQQQASAWTNDNQILSSHKWQLEHTFILLSSTNHQRCAKTQPYYSIYHEIIHLAVLTAPWNIWQLTDHPEARLWACMCGVNNVNLPLIYGKLHQSTLTLTDYRFSTSLTKWPSLNKVTTCHSRAKYKSCTPCAARYPSVVVFEGRATGTTNLRNIHSGWIAWQKSRTTGTNGRRPLHSGP